MIMPEQANLNLPEELKFLLRAQMKEADLIVLNKTDTISESEKEEILRFVKEENQETPVLCMSALTGEGVGEVVDYMMSHQTGGRHKDIGYGSEAFIAAESRLSWYNQRVFFEQKEDKALDFNEVFTFLFECVRKGLAAKNANVPHLKMFASDGAEQPDVFKASLIGIDYDVEYASKLKKQYSAISLVINARAAAGSDDMVDVMEDAIESVQEKYDLRAKTFFLESFGTMEQGRGNMGRASKY